MAHKKKHGNPVPPGNKPKAGPQGATKTDEAQGTAGGGDPFENHDAKNRLGDFESADEHSRQQPSKLNDAQRHSR